MYIASKGTAVLTGARGVKVPLPGHPMQPAFTAVGPGGPFSLCAPKKTFWRFMGTGAGWAPEPARRISGQKGTGPGRTRALIQREGSRPARGLKNLESQGLGKVSFTEGGPRAGSGGGTNSGRNLPRGRGKKPAGYNIWPSVGAARPSGLYRFA